MPPLALGTSVSIGAELAAQRGHVRVFFFFFNGPATTEIYTLSLHDALPICSCGTCSGAPACTIPRRRPPSGRAIVQDRKSTRLNSSHLGISYAVFCLKKKKKKNTEWQRDALIRAKAC